MYIENANLYNDKNNRISKVKEHVLISSYTHTDTN